MHSRPDAFREFLFFLADRVADWLQVQVDAGVSAYQLFDSWAGILSPRDQERFSLPAARRVFQKVKIPADFPTIYFAPGAGGALAAQAECGARMLGIDWRVTMADARAMLPDLPLQGNLDPGALLGTEEELELKVRSVLEGAGTRAGHVFNLGHGILPMTQASQAAHLVRLVHEISREMRK
jgi:uroporphyrinogen decarboxylase